MPDMYRKKDANPQMGSGKPESAGKTGDRGLKNWGKIYTQPLRMF